MFIYLLFINPFFILILSYSYSRHQLLLLRNRVVAKPLIVEPAPALNPKLLYRLAVFVELAAVVDADAARGVAVGRPLELRLLQQRQRQQQDNEQEKETEAGREQKRRSGGARLYGDAPSAVAGGGMAFRA